MKVTWPTSEDVNVAWRGKGRRAAERDEGVKKPCWRRRKLANGLDWYDENDGRTDDDGKPDYYNWARPVMTCSEGDERLPVANWWWPTVQWPWSNVSLEKKPDRDGENAMICIDGNDMMTERKWPWRKPAEWKPMMTNMKMTDDQLKVWQKMTENQPMTKNIPDAIEPGDLFGQ